MKISIETTTGLERRMTILIPSESFEEGISEKLTRASDQANLPGFRPGKVPMREIRRRYGAAVRAEVAGELMQSSFLEAIQEEDLKPAGSPKLDVLKMDPGIDFEFTAVFEVFPSFRLGDFSDVSIKKPVAKITKSDIEGAIDRLRKQKIEWDDIPGICGEEDRVTVDFSGSIDEEKFEGGAGEDVVFVVGAKQMIEDFDQALIGMAPKEEKSFEAKFPDDYQAEELQGKTAVFQLTLKKLERSRMPGLNDEFFKEFGVDEGGIEAFESQVSDNMSKELDAACANEVKKQIIDKIDELHEIQLPQVMVKSEIEAMKQQMLQQFQMYGGADNSIPELPDDMFKEEAEKRVSVGLIMRQVVSEGDMQPDEEKVKSKIEEIARQYPEPEKVISFYYGNHEQLHQIENSILEDQAIDSIVEKANIEELECSYEDVVAGRALAPETEDS